MAMKRRVFLQALVMVMGLPMALSAGPITADFSTLSLSNLVTNLGTGVSTIGPVSAQAFKLESGFWVPAMLIARNETNDQGLGVCTEGTGPTRCRIGLTGGGDYNELSQLGKEEAILLTLADGWTWSELWVSSLDTGGTGGTEEGRLYWGNVPDVATLLAGGSSFHFEVGDLPSGVEGEILSLTSGFNFNARHVLFRPDGAIGSGENNDYLMWGATANSVPEPATLTLLGLGLAGLRFARRRKELKA